MIPNKCNLLKYESAINNTIALVVNGTECRQNQITDSALSIFTITDNTFV